MNWQTLIGLRTDEVKRLHETGIVTAEDIRFLKAWVREKYNVDLAI